MLPSEELKIIFAKQMRITEEEVMNLFHDFIKKSPVGNPETWVYTKPPYKRKHPKGYHSGSFRAAWDISRKSDGSWVITNDVEYATILWDGRQFVAGRWYGSKQWPHGGQIMVEKFNRTLQKRLDRI